MLSVAVQPHGPYSLQLSAARASDATRTVRDGRLTAVLEVAGRLERTSAWQQPDGRVVLRAPSEAALAQLRFVLALDDDHSPFLSRFARDPLLGEATRRLRGLRPVRVATVAQALLRALCGQLIQARRARALERAVISAATPSLDGLHAPPSGWSASAGWGRGRSGSSASRGSVARSAG